MSAAAVPNQATSWWMRAEHIAIVIIFVALALAHLKDISWGRFICAFLLIDLIGYLPGAVASRRSRGKPIAPIYYLLYNLTHNYVVAGAAVVLWVLAAGGPEWAMVAVPIHLSGDRGLLGNFSKPLWLPFEPCSPAGATRDKQ
ncbi:MAG TPA: hypothetical protein VLV32_08105 [Burkholderiales bacterium]|nr:hypothetical protein [Burkholderiales bacterium]